MTTTLFVILCLSSPTAPVKKGFQVEPLQQAAPQEVAEKMRGVLVEQGLRVLDKKGEPYADVWLRKCLATVEPKPALGVKFGHVEEGALLGIIRFHQKTNDFKGNDFPAGVFTLRRGLQPIDGDHQGVSETRDFLVLAPVKVDQGIDGMSTKEAVKLSVQGTGIKHPSVLWLLSATASDQEKAKLPRMVEDETLELWTLECEIPAAAKDKNAVRLGIVLVGKAAEH